MNTEKDQISINISGKANTGKTVILAVIQKALKEAGFHDIRLVDPEERPETIANYAEIVKTFDSKFFTTQISLSETHTPIRKSKERYQMTAYFDVTPAQGIALEAMFDHWNKLASWGSSRMVGFYADGDGNFKPRCKVAHAIDPMTANENPEMTLELLKKSALCVSKDNKESNDFDFDGVAWAMHKQPSKEDITKLDISELALATSKITLPSGMFLLKHILPHGHACPEGTSPTTLYRTIEYDPVTTRVEIRGVRGFETIINKRNVYCPHMYSNWGVRLNDTGNFAITIKYKSGSNSKIG